MKGSSLTQSWPKAVLLDFYGTVAEDIRMPVQEIVRRISAVAPPEINQAQVVGRWARTFMGLCLNSFGPGYKLQKVLEQCSLQEALEYFKLDLDSRALSLLLSDYRAHPTLFPESVSVLSRCRVPVCLVTNIDNPEIRSAVEHTGLHFACMVTSEDCRAYKPRPETFKTALSLMGLSPREVLHVGDSLQSDIRGARELGIPVLWINRRKTILAPGDPQPDHTSSDLNGLLEILKTDESGDHENPGMPRSYH
jgi:2-haloalkanoic acid dehalogenase type II